jgi:hypothetical protein
MHCRKDCKTLKNASRTLPLIVALSIGAVAGSIVGELVKAHVPFLAKGILVGIPEPQVFRIGDIMTLALGISIKVNLATVAGVALAAIFVNRLM